MPVHGRRAVALRNVRAQDGLRFYPRPVRERPKVRHGPEDVRPKPEMTPKSIIFAERAS